MDEYNDYILLPARRLHITPSGGGGSAFSVLLSMQYAQSTSAPISVTVPGASSMLVIDSVNENGPKLVHAKGDQETALALASWAYAWRR